MAEDSDLERTEPASPRRLEQAREEGDVPRSRELATCTVLLAAGLGFWFTGEGLIRRLNHMLASGLSFDREQAFDFNLLMMRLGFSLGDVVIGLAPLAGILVLVALGSPLLIGGWLFTTKSLQPNFSRMNPLSGLGNMFSVRALVELLKAIGKTILVGTVAWLVVSSQIESMLALSVEPLASGSAHLAHLLLTSFISIVASLVVIALIDAPYQMWQYANKLKMTREEVRQEAKESDGDPQVKARIRQMQREMAKRRMMSEVPNADVVVTNPTHYAVALKYTEGKMRAPTVIAKGADEVAAKIREIAAEHKVALLEAPPLARALYRHTELGDEIPAALYTAVAEVLAYVFQLRAYSKHGGVRPAKPDQLDVPPELDPLNAAQVRPDNGLTQ
ncbi:flagellar biosynthesis protein FlhB [Noviherbaspirillum sp.]|jgi:flagellar biosynthetic protein FlhB|uniref:flagellar biosynthesis protein FlhB n=1 Tax=Noviherbaspirillum sp. TaxID=1926288 RepID=UPI0025DCEAD7|nr:flagellar biosynthesis protein FlhB [Noviherbaspirillum sp.]